MADNTSTGVDLTHAPMTLPLELRVLFRHVGTRWPLRDGDSIELYEGMTYRGEIPAHVVRALLTLHLSMAQLGAVIQKSWLPDPAPLTPAQLAALIDQLVDESPRPRARRPARGRPRKS